jgi:hypothetical protein
MAIYPEKDRHGTGVAAPFASVIFCSTFEMVFQAVANLTDQDQVPIPVSRPLEVALEPYTGVKKVAEHFDEIGPV